MGQRGDAVRFEKLGCSGYLLKPVKQQLLFDAVLAVLGREEKGKVSLITRHILSENRKTGIRLLLAEDNPINQKLAVITLQKANYQVDAVETGSQALEKVKTNQYSLVLMDVQMPEMDGFESTRRIREWETQNGQHIPIIAMTAHAMAGDRERCINAGMDDYVSKPLDPRVLFNVIDRWTQNMDSKKIIRANLEHDHSADAEQDFSANFDGDWLGESAPHTASEAPEFFDPTQDKLVPFSQADDFSKKIPVDLEGTLFRFGGDRAFMMEMCQEFKNHLSDRVEELRTALQGGEIEKLGRLAHNLKGLSMNFNAEILSNFALELEASSKQNNLADASALVKLIATEATRVQEFISQLPN
jgi:CheY-like chemotaxis protein